MASVTAIKALTDVELLDQVRLGNEAAFTELFVRHRAVARRVALTYRCPGDPDDLVNEAFEKVFAAVRRGAGPTDAFRAYLLVTMRRLAADHAERPRDERLDDVPETVVAAAAAEPLDHEDRELITKAFESLPDRWQAVLWYTAVEGRNPRELAPLLGVSANAVSALAYRAREQLRQAFLQAHLKAFAKPQCEPHRSLLGAYVRDGQSRRERAATQRHLDTCQSCQNLVAELHEVNSMLVRSVVPLFPAGLLAAKLAGVGAGAAGGGAAATASAAANEAAHLAHRGARALAWIKEAGTAVGGVAAATGLLVGLAGVGAYVTHQDDDKPEVSMLSEQPGDPTSDTSAPTTVPATGTPTAQAACAQATSSPTSEVATRQLVDPKVLSLDVDLPALSAFDGNEAPDVEIDDPVCTVDERGSTLSVELGAADDTETKPDLAAVDLKALDLNVTVELGTGATALGIDLPDACEILNDGKQVDCALESLADSNLGLQLDTEGEDAGATITVKQGDRTLGVKTVDVVSALGDTAGSLLGGGTP